MLNLTKGVSDKGGNYITPGVHVVRIVDVKFDKSKNDKPYLEISFVKDEDKGNENILNIRLYVSEKAKNSSGIKLAHLGSKLVKRDVLDAVEGNSGAEIADKYKKLFIDKPVRVKFSGREYVNDKGGISKACELGYPDFAEALVANTEYPVVKDVDSKLVYDESKDLKRVEQTNIVGEAPTLTDVANQDFDVTDF